VPLADTRLRVYKEGIRWFPCQDEIWFALLISFMKTELLIIIFWFWTDYIDLFLIHDPLSGKERRLATYKALQEAKAAGKIKSVGVSN